MIEKLGKMSSIEKQWIDVQLSLFGRLLDEHEERIRQLEEIQKSKQTK